MSQAFAENNSVGSDKQLAPEEELRMFRSLMRSLACDAENALNQLGMWCKDEEQLERCVLVQHYLDYMKRLCDGKV